MKIAVDKHARMAVMARLSVARQAAAMAEQRAADLLKKRLANKIKKAAVVLARTAERAKRDERWRSVTQDPRFIARSERENLRRQAETIRIEQLRTQQVALQKETRERDLEAARQQALNEAALREEDRKQRDLVVLRRLQAIKDVLPLVTPGERAGHADAGIAGQHRITLEIVDLDLEFGMARIILDRAGEFISFSFGGEKLGLGRGVSITTHSLLGMLDRPKIFHLMPTFEAPIRRDQPERRGLADEAASAGVVP